jgi:hypothetical protein
MFAEPTTYYNKSSNRLLLNKLLISVTGELRSCSAKHYVITSVPKSPGLTTSNVHNFLRTDKMTIVHLRLVMISEHTRSTQFTSRNISYILDNEYCYILWRLHREGFYKILVLNFETRIIFVMSKAIVNKFLIIFTIGQQPEFLPAWRTLMNKTKPNNLRSETGEVSGQKWD